MKLKALRLKRNDGEKQKRGIGTAIAKGVLVALTFSLIGVLIFAFVLKFTNISEGLITPVNQIIKYVSILLGTAFALKKQREIGLLSGLIIGILYTLVAFFVFSVLSGHFAFDWTLLVDCAFGALIGGLCGIICVNIKKSSV